MEPVVQASIGSLDTVLLQSAGQILGDILFGILEIVSIIPRALTIFAKILMVGLGTFFSVFYLNFTQSFLLFPNPATVPGLAVLGDRMMTLFWLVSPVFVLVWVAQSMMFPNDGERERTLRVLTQRLLKILILIFIAQPAISLIVATTHFFTAFFYPVGFDFRTAVDLMLSLGSSSGGTWATFLILVFGGFFIFLSSLVFFVILIVREFLVYLVYALAPLWGLFYIVDFGPAGFIKQFASSFMKIAGFMLLLGPIIAIVFATGFGIADYTTGAYAQGEQDIQFASGGSEPSSFSTRIIEDIAGAPNEASDGQFQSSGPGPDWKVEPNGISIPEIVLLKTIMFFGSIWLAIGIAIRGMSIAGGSSMSRDVQQFASRIDTRRARMLRARAAGAAEQVYTDVTGNQISSSAPGGPSRFEASINNVDPDNIFKAESARDYGPLDGVAERLDSVLPRGASDAGKFGEGMRLTGRGLYGVGRVAARPTLRGSVREAGYIVGASDALSAYDTDEISAIPMVGVNREERIAEAGELSTRGMRINGETIRSIHGPGSSTETTSTAEASVGVDDEESKRLAERVPSGLEIANPPDSVQAVRDAIQRQNIQSYESLQATFEEYADQLGVSKYRIQEAVRHQKDLGRPPSEAVDVLAELGRDGAVPVGRFSPEEGTRSELGASEIPSELETDRMVTGLRLDNLDSVNGGYFDRDMYKYESASGRVVWGMDIRDNPQFGSANLIADEFGNMVSEGGLTTPAVSVDASRQFIRQEDVQGVSIDEFVTGSAEDPAVTPDDVDDSKVVDALSQSFLAGDGDATMDNYMLTEDREVVSIDPDFTGELSVGSNDFDRDLSQSVSQAQRAGFDVSKGDVRDRMEEMANGLDPEEVSETVAQRAKERVSERLARGDSVDSETVGDDVKGAVSSIQESISSKAATIRDNISTAQQGETASNELFDSDVPMDKADVEMFADMAGGDMDTQEMARQIEARYQQPGVDIDEAREDVKQLILDQGLGD